MSWGPEAACVLAAVVLAAALVVLVRRRRDGYRSWLEARVDDLTGLGNRRGWRERVERLQREERGFAFALFDVANLKAANAVLGHVIADEVLRSVARVVRANEGPGYRLGGDEFGVVIAGGTFKEAEALRDRIEERVGTVEVVPGVVVFIAGAVGRWAPGENLSDRLVAADHALEQRKSAKKARLGLPLTREELAARLPALRRSPNPCRSSSHDRDPFPQQAT